MTNRRQKSEFAIFLIGLALGVMSYLLWKRTDVQPMQNFFAQAILSVGLAFIGVALLHYSWSVVGGDPISYYLKDLKKTIARLEKSAVLLDDSRLTGLERLHSTSGSLALDRDWMTKLKGAREHLDLMGYSLYIWTRCRDFEKEITKLIGAGVEVRVLIMSKDNPDIKALVNEQITAMSTDLVNAKIAAAHNVFSGISCEVGAPGKKTRGGYEFRVLKKGLIVTDICRTDSRLTAIHYLYSAVASESPLLEVRGTKSALFEVYMGEFKSLWKLGVHPSPSP